MYRIGIDVGGTFTDLVGVDEGGRATLAKVPSTPADPSIGVLDGLAALAALLGRDRASLLGETDRIVHGTTVATNALLEHKGARVGLLTTEGHRDAIEMREGRKDDRYNLRMPPPVQLVPRHLRLPVRERMRADGRVEIPLDPDSLARAIAALKHAEVEAVAVCYLHAYRDDRHERATAEALAREMPEAYVSLSSQVLPQIKEFERVSTTVVNAYVGPALSRYLEQLRRRLSESGYRGPTLIIQSHGGVAPIAESGRLAAGAVLSGPAGGVAGSVYAARLLPGGGTGAGNLIPFDMGGTSTDICLVVEGEASLVMDRKVGAHRIALNSLDIASIGAGGGSIARVDAGGILHVGPESAGADPGPACYGRGGTAATVTDANLVLGYLDAASFLGGERALERAAAEAAVDRVAGALGIERLAAARGIHRVVNTNMAEGVRLVSVRRGVDPRRFALFAFGGAAGLHATDVARQLGLARTIVPRVAAVLSAWGMLATDLRFEVSRTHIGDARALDGAAVKHLFDDMEAEGRRRLRASFDGPIRVYRSVDMRYGEQVFEITVPFDGLDWSTADPLPQIVERFHRRHEALYTYSMPDQDSVLVNARVTVSGLLEELPQEPALPPREQAAPSSRRRLYLDDWVVAPVYDFDALAPTQAIDGPALVESAMTTVLLRPGDRAVVTDRGWLDIAVPST
ncbi:MAG: hydantoinase/oxoprolinase family protein [Alphaproteobacteria bacterium]|nr:hydantoinase/oxoprolinase family protein [Alphaproteobacteria bacterium]